MDLSIKYLQRYFLFLLISIAVVIPLLITSLSDKDNLDLRVVNGGGFELQTFKGKLTNNDLVGKVVIVFFGYLSCPDYCPTAMINISSAFKLLSKEELSNTRALFISVDPSRDSVDSLEKYVNYFHPNIIGATTIQSKIDDIIQRYGGSYKINDKGIRGYYTVDHSLGFLLLDQFGNVVSKINSDTSPIKLSRIIRSYFSF